PDACGPAKARRVQGLTVSVHGEGADRALMRQGWPDALSRASVKSVHGPFPRAEVEADQNRGAVRAERQSAPLIARRQDTCRGKKGAGAEEKPATASPWGLRQ